MVYIDAGLGLGSREFQSILVLASGGFRGGRTRHTPPPPTYFGKIFDFFNVKYAVPEYRKIARPPFENSWILHCTL